MINDDIIIKFIRKVRGYKTEWPEKVIQFKSRLEELKLGFPGIGNDDISLDFYENIMEGDIFIYDGDLEKEERGDEAPVMLKKLEGGKYLIFGIGFGYDLKRDPLRLKLRWGDIIESISLSPRDLVVKVDARPTLNGGAAYYYFYRSYRDFRY